MSVFCPCWLWEYLQCALPGPTAFCCLTSAQPWCRDVLHSEHQKGSLETCLSEWGHRASIWYSSSKEQELEQNPSFKQKMCQPQSCLCVGWSMLQIFFLLSYWRLSQKLLHWANPWSYLFIFYFEKGVVQVGLQIGILLHQPSRELVQICTTTSSFMPFRSFS